MGDVLITGAAGFIGFSLAKNLLQEGHNVVGLDNMNSYYDPELKKQRILHLENYSEKLNNFKFVNLDLEDMLGMSSVLKNQRFDYVYHFAAQAGVRYSLENPRKYFESNVIGTFNLIEILKSCAIKRLVLASTSSIYGNSHKSMVTESDALNPIQFYAVSKEIDETMCKIYSQIYDLNVTIFRFFTVYGPWGRPDMALFKFVKSIINKHPIEIYNNGNHKRSFTYIDDVIFYLTKVMELSSEDKYEVYNLGNPVSVDLLEFIKIIEDKLAITAEKIYLPLQFGDVHGNLPSIEKLTKKFGEKKFMNVGTGISNFIDWYKSHYL
jgi:UDP-glucuronate 4-epimerase